MDDGGTRVLTCEQMFLNFGTHPAIPDVPGLDGAGPLTNIEALELDYAARTPDRARRRFGAADHGGRDSARSCQMWRLGPKEHPLRTRQFGAAIEGPIGTGPLTLSAYIANIFR